MGAFKEIYDEYMYQGNAANDVASDGLNAVVEGLETNENSVDLFTELLPGFGEVLAFERPLGTLSYNPFAEIPTPLRPIGFLRSQNSST